jgi:hypothetical protein
MRSIPTYFPFNNIFVVAYVVRHLAKFYAGTLETIGGQWGL